MPLPPCFFMHYGVVLFNFCYGIGTMKQLLEKVWCLRYSRMYLFLYSRSPWQSIMEWNLAEVGGMPNQWYRLTYSTVVHSALHISLNMTLTIHELLGNFSDLSGHLSLLKETPCSFPSFLAPYRGLGTATSSLIRVLHFFIIKLHIVA
jgi:hypothetical protein